MNKNKLLMYFFVGSEAFFFLSLIISFVYYRYTGRVFSDSFSHLDVKTTALFTIALLSSSLTIFLADKSLDRQNRKGINLWLILTVVLGLIFLVGQGSEYSKLYNLNFTIGTNVLGSAFFTLTGFHGLHVLIGLIILSIVLIMTLSGRFVNIEQTALRSASIYWHFVDIVWIAVFTVVYLGQFAIK
jgi:heme/copper-type cytochrome/quinol oxidase subunit 3